jgi:uncharacterized membrane protein YqjE
MIFGAARPRRSGSPARSGASASASLPQEPLPPRLIPSIRQLFSTAVSLAHTRIALAGLELEEEIQRLIKAAVLGFVALLLGFLGILVGTFTIVLAVPEDYRVLTMVIITVVYLAAAVAAVFQIKAIFSGRPPIFGATLAELEKDKETLSQMARAHDAAEEARERELQQEREARSRERLRSRTAARAS